MKHIKYLFLFFSFFLVSDNIFCQDNDFHSTEINLVKIVEIKCNEEPYKMGAGEGIIPLPAISFAFDSLGNVFINDGWGRKVIVLDSSWNYLRSFPIAGQIHIDMSMDCNDNLYLWDSNCAWKYSKNGELLSTLTYRDLTYDQKLEDITSAPSFRYLLCNDLIGSLIDSLYWTGKVISIDQCKLYINVLMVEDKQLKIKRIDYNGKVAKEVNLILPGYVYMGEPEDGLNVWRVFRNDSDEYEINFFHFFNDYFKFFVEVGEYYLLLSDASYPSILIFSNNGAYLFKFNLDNYLLKNNIELFDAIEEPAHWLNKFNDKAYLMLRTTDGVIFYRIDITDP